MVYSIPDEYLFNLEVASSSEAKRLWKKSIKEEWNGKCAYCNSDQDLTIDHIIPQSKGGKDVKTNVVCACKTCNLTKGYNHWEDWFMQQEFFTIERRNDIIKWMKEDEPASYVVYRPRKNIINI
jgi:CRISPR/Cas system Type II protein with McrA/HNH and RuvC-like nuclease domain